MLSKCHRHHYAQANTNNVNKTRALLQTTRGKDEANIVLRVDPTLICLYISSFYFKQHFMVYEINFEHLIGFS
jgi:hypothetical protein